jgi:hypothetical protein
VGTARSATLADTSGWQAVRDFAVLCQAGRVAEGSRSLPTSRGDVESGLQAVEDALEAVLEVLVHRLLRVLAGGVLVESEEAAAAEDTPRPA